MSESRRHHVVPEFYLKRFARDGVIELVDKQRRRAPVLTGTRVSLVERDFYTLDGEEGKDLSLETFFANEIEGPAARALRRMVDERRAMSFPGLRRAVSMFLGFQFVRGPGTRGATVQFFNNLSQQMLLAATPEIMKAELERQGEVISLAEATDLVRFAQAGDYEINPSSESGVHVSMALSSGTSISEFLEKRAWTILEFGCPALMTGDEPIGLVGRSRVPGEISAVFSAEEVVVALDPWHALIISGEVQRNNIRLAGTRQMADVINEHVAFRSRRFLVRYPARATP